MSHACAQMQTSKLWALGTESILFEPYNMNFVFKSIQKCIAMLCNLHKMHKCKWKTKNHAHIISISIEIYKKNCV